MNSFMGLRARGVAPRLQWFQLVTFGRPAEALKWFQGLSAVTVLLATAACSKSAPAPHGPAVSSEAAIDEVDGDEDPCADTRARREVFIEEHADDVHEGPGAEDHAYPPDCHVVDIENLDDLDPPWDDVTASCEIQDEIYGPKGCSLRFRRRYSYASIAIATEAASAKVSAAVSLQDVLPGGDLEAIVRFRADQAEWLAVCGTAPVYDCTQTFLVAGDGWRARESFSNGELVLESDTGTPPPEVLGPHPLVLAPPDTATPR